MHSYFYGLAADPLTKGHITIIKSLIKRLKEDETLHIMISNNDEKIYSAPAQDRLQILDDVVQDILLNKEVKGTVCTCIQNERMHYFLRKNFSNLRDEDITIVVGDDEFESLLRGEWVNAELLLQNFSFLVYSREGKDDWRRNPISTEINYKTVDLEVPDTSSTRARRLLLRDPGLHYDTAIKFLLTHQVFREIKKRALYKQNPPTYEQDQKAYLKTYEEMKEKNHWGEPSVTTDIVAFNGNKILLIRRGNYPYKNYWCLCGGFMDLTDPELKYTAARELKEETHLDIDANKFHQIKTYSHMFDPRMRIVDVAFEVRVSKKEMDSVSAGDDANEARWFSLDDLPPLGFHHRMIIEDWKQKRDGNNDYL